MGGNQLMKSIGVGTDMKIWKYKVRIIGAAGIESELDRYGEDGWELVNVIEIKLESQPFSSPDYKCFFKKEK